MELLETKDLSLQRQIPEIVPSENSPILDLIFRLNPELTICHSNQNQSLSPEDLSVLEIKHLIYPAHIISPKNIATSIEISPLLRVVWTISA